MSKRGIADNQTIVSVEDLLPGDMIDLEHDKHADPDSTGGYGYEYAVVYERLKGTDADIAAGIVVLHIEHLQSDAVVAFPSGHKVKKITVA